MSIGLEGTRALIAGKRTTVTTGTIRRLTDRHYGFIETQDRRDLFFHASALQDTDFDDLREGQRVEFEVERDPRGKGDRATNVRPS